MVRDIHVGRELPERYVMTWLQGGAAFWREDHYYRFWGLRLPSAIDEDDINNPGIRRAILSADDWFRYKFGSIPLRAQSGEEALAITAYSGFMGDSLYGFYVDEGCWLKDMEEKGWLLGDSRNSHDAVAMRTDEELIELWRRRDPRMS